MTTEVIPLKSYKTSGHAVALGEFIAGDVIPVSAGGTGASDAATARANLGITGSGGGSGEANTSSNLGTGTGLAATKSGVNLPFKSLVAGSGITIAADANQVTINATAGGGGSVTSASVVSANGFAGTVATPSTTPAITLTTLVTGMIKGLGNALTLAVAGTDYQAPIGTIGGLAKGNGPNALTAAVVGTDYQAPIGTISGVAKGNGANALTAAIAGTDYTTPAGSENLTNKRISPRVGSTTSSATPTINTDTVDIYKLTAQAVAITSMTSGLSGTPVDNQCLIIEITGTAAVAITWGTSFESSTVTLPTTTVGTAMLAVAFIWNTATSKWRCVAAV